MPADLTNIWTFKYAPKTIDEMVLNDEEKTKLKGWIQEVPNMLLSGPPGVGKGTFVNILLNYTGYDYIKINCSDETGIENIRNKVKSFACALGTTNLKIVYLNECLEENEEILLANDTTEKMKNLVDFDEIRVKSFNTNSGMLEEDTAEIISDKMDDTYILQLEDGKQIKTNKNHPFLVIRNLEYKFIELKDLTLEDLIVVVNEPPKEIRKISYIGNRRVINLNVKNNSTIVSKNGIVTHNCDYLSHNAQAMLRDLIEQVEDLTRFVFACNYSNNMLPELISRCRTIYLQSPPYKEAIRLCKEIIGREEIEVTNKTDLLKLVKHCLPDIRKMILTLQENCINGKFEAFDNSFDNSSLYESIWNHMKNSDPEEIRKILKSYPILYNELFKYMYETVMENPDSVKSPGDFIIKTGEYYYKSHQVAIKEILFMTYVFEVLKGGFLNG